MVISDNVQMWLIVITVGVFSVVAIVFWLWENVLGLFYEIQRDTGKKYSKIQWILFCLCGLTLIFLLYLHGLGGELIYLKNENKKR